MLSHRVRRTSADQFDGLIEVLPRACVPYAFLPLQKKYSFYYVRSTYLSTSPRARCHCDFTKVHSHSKRLAQISTRSSTDVALMLLSQEVADSNHCLSALESTVGSSPSSLITM